MNTNDFKQLLLDQRTEVEQLENLISNYKKAGHDRKTQRFLNDKKKVFSEIFLTIEKNHQKLQPYANENKKQPYFKDETYVKIKAAYDKVMENILKCLEKFEHEKGVAAPNASMKNIWSNDNFESNLKTNDSKDEAETEVDESSLSFVIENGDDIVQPSTTNITIESGSAEQNADTPENDNAAKTNDVSGNEKNDDHESNAQKSGDINSNVQIEQDLMQLQYNEFMNVLNTAGEMHEQSPKGTIKAYQDNLTYMWNELRKLTFEFKTSNKPVCFSYNVMMQRYIEISGKLNDLLSVSQVQSSSTDMSSSNHFSLPKLKLPAFSGNRADWKSFIALFDKMVHNNPKLDNNTKIEYLKTCVSGPAARVIGHLDPYPENYEPCYALMRNRFDNKRELVESLLDKILQLPKIKYENSESLKSMHDTTYESLMAIKNLGISNIDLLDHLLCYILFKKLDSSTLVHYECQLKNVKELQTVPNFLTYLENRFMALQSVCTKNEFHYNKFEKQSLASNTKNSSQSGASPTMKNSKCLFCDGEHALFKCISFTKRAVSERVEWAKAKKLCLNCISTTSHRTHDCKSKFTCKSCGKRHHSLLHLEAKKSEERIIKATVARVQNNIQATVCTQQRTSVLLATAMVGTYAKNGNKIMLRALLDQGSQSAFVTEEAAQTLGLQRKSITATVTGIGARKQIAKHAISLSIFPRFESEFLIITDAIVLPQLTCISHNMNDENDFSFVNNLLLADPSFLNESSIDLILGAAEYAQAIKCGLIKSESYLIAQNTEFGWVVSGSIASRNTRLEVTTLVTNVELETTLKKFFSAEEFEMKKEISEEEEYCENHFKETTYRSDTGKFVVSLPFKNKMAWPELGDSRKVAIATQLQLERRFEKNSVLREEYNKQIIEALELGHIEEIKHDPLKTCHYLPHHCVFKDSTTTAVRIVYNASRKTSNGMSLNEQLAIGATDQEDLTSILIKFRSFKYAFTADIEKMYKQILLNHEQLDLQRFVYRFSPEEPFREFRHKTLTFGFSPAPYLAIRVLKELAEQSRVDHPLAASIIKFCMYMDDALGGCHNFDELLKIYEEMKSVCNSAGFNIRKWCSNSPEFLNSIPECDKESKALHANVKALGISWNPTNDVFTYDYSVSLDSNPLTKRQLTSEIASLFDPLGWISPVVISAKNILQQLWYEKCDWDAAAPEKYVKAWLKIKSQLDVISNLSIPRFVNYNPSHKMELHGFCDASEAGYAAAIYIVNLSEGTSHLLISKARVSPIKETKNNANVTIPRLELCGALLLAQLADKVLKALNIEFDRICLWSDARIVLDWLHANPSKFLVFVSARVKQINKLVELEWWSHVRSEENAADCASRGILPTELANHSLWWHGPRFLIDKSLEPPRYKPKEVEIGTTSNIVMTANTILKSIGFLPNVSSFNRLKRIIAYVFRFVSNTWFGLISNHKDGVTKETGVLTASELEKSSKFIFKIMQEEEFKTELLLFTQTKSSPNSNKKLFKKASKLMALSPFLDDDGLLRVGGRLGKSDLPYDSRHQILLPKNHPITSLIINECHKRCCHGGPKLTESILRQRFWICDSQRTIKAVLSKCVSCFRANPKIMQQYMSDLPSSRVKADKPFAKTAIDYTGAVRIKVKNGRGFRTHKAYIAIFVCMTTKAIHIEAVSDMTADAFIAAFRRFVSRRGAVRHIFSDNGTNFVLANKILMENIEKLEAHYHESICNELAANGTKWHFSPPGAPHFNGLAEAAVKSVKLHLKKTISDTALTFEELSTLLAQVEACVNSRPLCQMSSDPNDVGVLTPGHFLIGESLISSAEPCHIESKASWLTRWQRVQQMAQHFWKRWSDDVLNQWQMRTKWQKERASLNVNDMVLIKDENLPPAQWLLGRVDALHPGDDGLVRVVSVKTQNGIRKRPIAKLCSLPHNENDPIDGVKSDNTNIVANVSKVSKISRAQRTRPISVLPVLTAIMALCTTVTYSSPISTNQYEITSKPFEITRFKSAPGFYFEKFHDVFMTHSDWTVLSHLNLQTLQDEFLSIRSNLTRAKECCFRKGLKSGGCRSVISQLSGRVDKLEMKNTLIFGSHRTKRAVPTLHFIGDILGDFTGLVGSKFTAQYEKDLSEIHDNQDHLLLLLKNNTSVLDSTLNLIKHDENEIQKQSIRYNELASIIRNQTDAMEIEHTLHNFFACLIQSIDEYERQQSAIIEIITDSKREHINHELFTPSEIEAQIELISKQVGNEFLIPNGVEVYAVSKISVFRLKNQYIFKLSIPLLKTQKFKLYRIIAMPTVQAEGLFILENNHKFLLTSTDRQLFQYVNDISCIPYQNKKSLICDKPNQFFTAAKSDCVWNVFNHLSKNKCSVKRSTDSIFFESIGANKFLFAFREGVKITVICGDRVFHDQLAGEGALTLQPQCTLGADSVQLISRITLANEKTEVVIPEINVEPWTFSSPSTTPITPLEHVLVKSEKIEELQKMINHTRENAYLKYNSHDIHHYTMSYIIIFSLISYIVFNYVKTRKIISMPSLNKINLDSPDQPSAAGENVDDAT